MAEAALEIDIVDACPLWRGCEDALSRALAAAATVENVAGSVSLLLGDDASVSALNRQFRGKEGAANVLSFPPLGVVEPGFLGDIALAAETIAMQAEAQGKKFQDHAAHLVVHGFLHLLGYDHNIDADAQTMEAREREILAIVGIRDPYAEGGM